MKNYKLPAFLIALLFTVANVAVAQYDDIYYDPDKDAVYSEYKGDRYSSSNDRSNYSSRVDETERYYYDDDEYEYYDDYDYHYTSRVRRFHRPFYGFDYYDPVYVDMAYYDPFFTPGLSTVLIYNNNYSYWNWRRWNQWNRAYRYDPWLAGGMWSPYYGFNDPFFFGGRPGWNVGFGFNRWNSWGFNNWGFNNFGFNNFGYGFSNFYCPPAWGNNAYVYNTVNVVNSDYNTGYRSYYGPRRTGTSTIARNNDRIYRATENTTATPKDVTTNAPTRNTSGERVYNDPATRSNPQAITGGRNATRDDRVIGANAGANPRTATRTTEPATSRTATTPRATSPRISTSRNNPYVSPRSDNNTTRSASPNTTTTRRRSLFGTSPSRSSSPTTPSTRSSDRSYTPRSSSGNSSYTPRSSSGSSRSYTPRSSSGSSRSYTPRSSSGSSRSYTPRSSSGSSRSYTPSSSSSGSSRSYTPSRSSSSSSGSSSSYTPSRSSSSSSSGASRSSSSRRGGGNE